MSDREKLLGIVVGALLLFFAGFGIFRSVKSGFTTRNANISNLDSQIEKTKSAKLQALQAANLVQQYKMRSLNSDLEKANLEFDKWLKRQVQEVGLKHEFVRYNGVRAKKDAYKELTYTANGEGDITQITDLVYRIQASDTLHRIETFAIRPGPKSGKLKLEMIVAALTMGDLNSPQPKAAIGEIVEGKLPKTLDEYQDIISVRNLFAPGNNSPKFDDETSKTVELGKRLDWKMNAKDPDGHELEYKLVESPDDSAKLEKGKLEWKPKELGKYEFQVEVRDDGVPAKTDIATLTVKVVPEEKKEEKKVEDFDDATQAFITAFLQGPRNPDPRIVLDVRSKDERIRLVAGDKIDIGKWQGVVKAVDAVKAVALLESEDGKAYELGIGQALSEAQPVKL